MASDTLPNPGAAKGRLHFLDGLRGFGAVMVLFSHLVAFFMTAGITVRYPWLRFVSDGALAVYIFFIISGFALTESLAGYARSRGLRPLIVKRYIRLVAPVCVAVLFAYALLRLGLMHNLHQETSPTWAQGLFKQSPNFWRAVFDGLFGAVLGAGIKYDPVLWSIRPEFFCSITLYVVFFYLEPLKRKFGPLAAWWLALILMPITLVAGPLWLRFKVGPLWFCFLMGVGFCLLERHWKPSVFWQRVWQVAGLLLFAAAALASTFWRGFYESGIVPALIALVLFTGVRSSSMLRGVCSSPLGRFLGDISFPLYLIHLPILCSLGPVLYDLSKGGKLALPGIVGPVWTTVALMIPACLVAAWVFMHVEKRLLRWCYARCSRWL